MNELSIIVMMLVAGILWAAMSYSVGYKEGQREGFKRGRAVSRHAAKDVR
jgi:formate hydrogenlyase subunit 3/multisubunit Na+/H+ antiporter MnhD subunit